MHVTWLHITQFHHGCQTEWEMAHYSHCDSGKCDYESSYKYCMVHHPFGALAIRTSSSTPQEVEVAAASAQEVEVIAGATAGAGKETTASKKKTSWSYSAQ